MTCQHFNALVERQSGGRSVRRIAREAGIPDHWIAYYLRPDTELARMPTEERIDAIGLALSVSSAEVRAAFRRDLDDEPLDREVAELWAELPPPYRRTWLQMGRSLTHLASAVSQGGTPESGDGRAAV